MVLNYINMYMSQVNTNYLCVIRCWVSPPLVLQTLPHVAHTWPVLTLSGAASELEVPGLDFLLLYLNRAACGRYWRLSLALRSNLGRTATGLLSLSSSSEFSLSSSSSSPSWSSALGSPSLSSVPPTKPLLKLLASCSTLRGSCTKQMGQEALFDIEYPWSLQGEDLPRQTLWKVWPQLRRCTGRLTLSSSALQSAASQANRGSGSSPFHAYPNGKLRWSTVASREGR